MYIVTDVISLGISFVYGMGVIYDNDVISN